MLARMDRQLFGFGAGAVLPFVTALLVTPLIARNLSDSSLLIAGASLVAHAMFGLFDVFRPILIRKFVSLETSVSLFPTMIRPVLIAIPLGALITTSIVLFLPDLGADFAAAAGLSLIVFLLGTPFWARLDASKQTGLAYVLRASGLLIIYLLLAATPMLLSENAVPWFLLVGNLFPTIALYWAARNLFSRKGEGVRMPVRELTYVLGQNLLKSLGDYADRIAIVATGNVALAAQFNLLADIPAKSNMPSQIAVSYVYPRLCESDDWLRRFVFFGALYSFAISTAALCLYLFGKPLFLAYYGVRFEGLFAPFCLLLTVAATYTLSFYGQAFLRARALDAQLLVAFGVSGVIGATYLFVGPLDLVRVLVSLIIFRSCSLWMTLFALSAGARVFSSFLPAYGYSLAIALYLLGIIAS